MMTLSNRSLRPTLAALVIAALGAAVPGQAHSFWPSYHSAKTALSLGEKGLEAAVVVEVPSFEMVSAFREYYSDIDLIAEIEAGRFEPLEDEFRADQLTRFGAGLELFIDGRPVSGSWQPVDSPANGLATEGFFVYMLEFVFDRPPELGERVEVRLEARLLQEKSLMMANVVQAKDGWEVVQSSIPPPEEYPELPEGAALGAELGLWSEDPVKRDLRVSFARSSE